MKFIGIIPARYASTRFPAKPLAMLGGKPVIQRVYEQVAGVLDEAYVATDDERIEAAVKAFGGKVVMTSVNHKSGTDRCYEAFTKVGEGYDVIVNIQGDEPFIQPSQLEAIKAYDVWQEKKLYGKVSMGVVRSTYIIDENGVIEKVMPKVKPDTNAAEILEYLAGK